MIPPIFVQNVNGMYIQISYTFQRIPDTQPRVITKVYDFLGQPSYIQYFKTMAKFAFIPSASTSLIISCNSASVGFCPSDLMTVPSSLVVIVPSPSLSNRLKASLNSGITPKLT